MSLFDLSLTTEGPSSDGRISFQRAYEMRASRKFLWDISRRCVESQNGRRQKVFFYRIL